jgi:hypothetical protein
VIDTTQQEFLETIAPLLGGYYVAAGGANVLAAWRGWRAGAGRRRAAAWLALAVVFLASAGASFAGRPPGLPDGLKSAIDSLLSPLSFSLGSLAVLTTLYLGRRFFVVPAVAWAMLSASLLFLGLSLADAEFARVVLKPDNVPIVAMVYLLGFFLWLGAAQAVKNDERMARGEGPVERQFAEPVLVWPDLVYIELISMVLLSAVLIVWSMVLRAPLEQPANPAVTPNPSKAPWYFLGLQEMLVFFDPAMAGVVIPGLIIFGLAAIPYLDRRPEGSGYYTIVRRRPGYLIFLFGLLQLWVLLILVGTFFRGPNWNFFGPYEPRDPHRVLALNNVKLSEYFWVLGLGRALPQVPDGAGVLVRLGVILWREVAGIVLLGLYFAVLPAWLGRTALRALRRNLGRTRYWITILLLLLMLALPLKMLLRWTVSLSYVVSMPEYFFNF